MAGRTQIQTTVNSKQHRRIQNKCSLEQIYAEERREALSEITNKLDTFLKEISPGIVLDSVSAVGVHKDDYNKAEKSINMLYMIFTKVSLYYML